MQAGCDLGVGQPESDQSQDFAFPFGYLINRGCRAVLGFGVPGELPDEPPGDGGGEQRVAGRDDADRGQQVGWPGVLEQEALVIKESAGQRPYTEQRVHVYVNILPSGGLVVQAFESP
jgi:hypothetical protein